jgi:hypothetical protein
VQFTIEAAIGLFFGCHNDLPKLILTGRGAAVIH